MSSFTVNVPTDTFQPTDNEPKNIVRTGYYCSICEETWHELYTHRDEDGTWHVPASGGGFYRVSRDANNVWRCDCAGFEFRGRCRHLCGNDTEQGVVALERAGKKHSLSDVVWVSYEQRRWPPDLTIDQL